MEEKIKKQAAEKPKTTEIKPGRKIRLTSISCHQGVTLKPNGAGIVTNGINAEKLNVDLEVCPAGVLVIFKDEGGKGKGKLVPYTNITQGDVEFEE